MSPDSVRKILAEEFNYDINAMASNYGRSYYAMLDIIRNGGSYWARHNRRVEKKTVKAAFDVRFSIATEIHSDVADPGNLTEKEKNVVVKAAIDKILSNASEYVIADNLDGITLHAIL